MKKIPAVIGRLLMSPFVGVPLLMFVMWAYGWYGYTPQVEAQVEKPAFAYYYVGTVVSPRMPHPYIKDSEVYGSIVSVYWFASGDDECYVSMSSTGNGISCMKKGRE